MWGMGVSKKMRVILLAMVMMIVIFVLSACYITPYITPDWPRLKEFSEHQVRWKSYETTRYRMRLERNCFCGEDYLRPLIVEVQVGKTMELPVYGSKEFLQPRTTVVRIEDVESAVYEDDGKPVPLDELQRIASIDSLFHRIYIASLRNPSLTQRIMDDLVQVDYNAEYGYPEFVVFDSDAMTDAYISYDVELLDIIR